MRRYQTRSGTRAWTDAGPDLLRSSSGAIAAVGDVLKRRRHYLGRRIRAGGELGEWKELGKRAAALEWLEHAIPTTRDEDRLQIGERAWGEIEIRAVVRTREITVEQLAGATERAELTNALYEAAFPASLYAGAFVCKQISGSSSWSTHAWGDAVDRTASENASNDAMTDWGARMAAAGELPVVQILGSQNGRVVEAKRRLIGSWRLRSSSASTSHLWHVHNTCAWHTGRPPCSG